MATATVSPAQDSLVAEIFIAAPPARVFEAITDPAQASQWWGQNGRYRIVDWKGDLRPGGKWLSVGVAADGVKFQVEGEYLEVDPPRLLVHTWISSYHNGVKSVVRWELEPQTVHGLQHSGPHKVGTGTLVRIRHNGFDPTTTAAADHGQGWIRVLGWMQSFIEKGETIETRPLAPTS
jgi:uncharacterized protein YndB with AHSA1/START domain